jgi:hypothetical protein
MPKFTGIEPFTTWDGAFTPQELDAIVALGDTMVRVKNGCPWWCNQTRQ